MTGMSTLYLSRDCAINLGIIHLSYPQLGDMEQGVVEVLGDAMEERNAGELGETQPCSKMSYVAHDYPGLCTMDCKCPVRTLPPVLPKHLPFEPVPENRENFRWWIRH